MKKYRVWMQKPDWYAEEITKKVSLERAEKLAARIQANNPNATVWVEEA